MPDEKCIRDPRHDCFGLEAAAKLEGRVKALEEWKDDSKKFHSDFYQWKNEQTARDARLDEKFTAMNNDMSEMKGDIKQVLETQKACSLKSGGRWNAIKDKVIVGVLTSLLTAAALALLVLAVNNLQ